MRESPRSNGGENNLPPDNRPKVTTGKFKFKVKHRIVHNNLYRSASLDDPSSLIAAKPIKRVINSSNSPSPVERMDEPPDISGFKAPKQKRRNTAAHSLNLSNASLNPIPLTNQFQPLDSGDMNLEQSDDEIDSNNGNQQKVPAGLPIICRFEGSPNEFLSIVHNVDAKAMIKSQSKSEYKILPTTQENYRKLIAYFSENGTRFTFHTYLSKDQRTIRMVLRGLPPNLDKSIIENALREDHNIIPKQIVNAKHTFGDNKGELMPIYYIDFMPTDDISILYSIRHLAYMSCKFEDYRPRSGPIHCKRCQQWNHAKGQCSRPVKCGICASSHETKDCPNPTNPRKCVNCGNAHASSWRGCEAYRILVNIPDHKVKITPPAPPSTDQYPPLPTRSTTGDEQTHHTSTPKPTYAQTTTRNSSNHQPNHQLPTDSTGLGGLIKDIVNAVIHEVVDLIKREIYSAFKNFNILNITHQNDAN